MSFLRGAVLVVVLLAAFGCKPKTQVVGELVGVYEIRGALVNNSCGQTALPTMNPLEFSVQITRDEGVGYWQIDKRAAAPGELEDDGSFRFTNEQTSLVSSMRGPRQDLEPTDFGTLNPDFDLKTVNCAMKVSETISGSLARSLVDVLDGGTDPSSNGDDLEGENVIEIEPTGNSDCSASLAAFGGTFQNLPCSAKYKLKGELIEAPK